MSKERDLDLRKLADESNPDWEMNYTEKSDEWPHKNKDDGDQYPYYRHPFHNKPGRKPGDGDQGNLFNANPADKTFYDIASKIEGNEIFDRYFLKDGHAWLSAVIFKKAHGDLKVGDVVISFGKTLKENNTICKRFGSVQKANESINETVREIFAVMSPMTPTDDTVLQEHQGLRPDQPGAYLKRKSPLPGKEDPSETKDKRQHQGYDYPALNPHRSPIPFEDDSIGATSTIKRSQGPQHIKSILEQIMEPISQAKTLEEAQEIAINHISASNINEKDKQTMIATFRGARNLERFLQSFYNALLKYEGFGVVSKNFNRIARIAWNPKTLVDAKEEIKPLVPYNQRVYVESMQSVAELQNTFVRNLSKVLAVDLEKIRKLLEETEAKAPNYSKAMYLTLLPLYPILTHPNVFEYTTPENLRWVVVDAIHMSSYLTDEQKNWSLHIVKQFNFDAEMGVLNFVKWVSNSILRGGGLGVQRLERPKVEKVPPQADFPPPEYAPEEPVEALPFEVPPPEEEEEEDEDSIVTSSDTHVKVFGSFKNEADVNLGIQELGLVGCFGGFTPTEGYFIASAKDTPQMNSIQATAILGRIKKGHSSYFDDGRLETFEPSQVDAQLRAEAVGRVLTPSMKSLILEHAEQGLTLQEIANKLNSAFETDIVKPQHVRTFLKRVLERPSLMEKYKKRRITPEVDVPRPERTEREKAIEEKKREYELLQAQPEGQAWFKEIEDPTKKREREGLPTMPPKEWKPTKKVVERKPEGEWQPAARVPTTPMTTQELKNAMQQMDKMIQEGYYPENMGALIEKHPWMSQIVSQEQLKPLGPLPEGGKVPLTEEELQIAVEDLQRLFTGQAKRAQALLQFPEDTGLESTVADNLRQMLQTATTTNDPARWFQYGQEFLNAFTVRGLTITETTKQHVRDVIRQLNPAAPLNQVESILARNAPGEMLEYLQSMYSTESPGSQMTSGLYETIQGLMMESPTAPIIAQKLSFRSTKQNIEEAHKRADIDKEIPLEKVEEKPKVVYIEEEVKIRVADKLSLQKTSQEEEELPWGRFPYTHVLEKKEVTPEEEKEEGEIIPAQPATLQMQFTELPPGVSQETFKEMEWHKKLPTFAWADLNQIQTPEGLTWEIGDMQSDVMQRTKAFSTDFRVVMSTVVDQCQRKVNMFLERGDVERAKEYVIKQLSGYVPKAFMHHVDPTQARPATEDQKYHQAVLNFLEKVQTPEQLQKIMAAITQKGEGVETFPMGTRSKMEKMFKDWDRELLHRVLSEAKERGVVEVVGLTGEGMGDRWNAEERPDLAALFHKVYDVNPQFYNATVDPDGKHWRIKLTELPEGLITKASRLKLAWWGWENHAETFIKKYTEVMMRENPPLYPGDPQTDVTKGFNKDGWELWLETEAPEMVTTSSTEQQRIKNYLADVGVVIPKEEFPATQETILREELADGSIKDIPGLEDIEGIANKKLTLRKTSQEEEDMFAELYPPTEKEKYDEQGRLVYQLIEPGGEDPTAWEGTGVWYEYDDQGKEIRRRFSNGEDWRFEYDDGGNRIHETRYRGNNVIYERWWEYDEQGKKIREKDTQGFDLRYEYDNEGNVIHRVQEFKDGVILHLWWDYDEKGNEISSKKIWYDAEGDEFEPKFDGEGRLIPPATATGKKLTLRKSSKFTGGRFVIHKHNEIKEGLHYDLRLEWPEGSLEKYQEKREKETPEPKGDKDPKTVLRCWVIQKGIPEKLGEERSAILIEDHPISYMSFEGTIPEGSYGGGEVEIFDSGTYDLIKKTSNKIAVDLQGKKIKGHYNLTKTDSNWLLAKCEGKAGKLNAEGALDWYDLPEEDRNLLTTITRGIEHQLNHDAEILAAKLKDDRFYFDLMDIVEKVGVPKEKIDLYTFIIHDLLTIDLAGFSGRSPEQTEGPEPGKQATIPLPVRMTLDYPHSWRKEKKETPTEKKKKEFEYKRASNLSLEKVADFDQATAQTSDIDPKVKNRIKEIQKEIPKEDLYSEEDEEGWVKDGKQTLLHMTVLYGVEDNDIPEIKELFQKHSKISVGTDKIHYFDQDDYTAAVLRCQSDEIRDLHGKLKRKLDVEEEYATYKPHITIAYLQPGKRLENEEFPNIKWEIDSLDVVKSSGKLQKIKKETSRLSLQKSASTPAEHEQRWNHPPSTYKYDGLQENPSGEPFIQLTCNTCGSTILSTLEELKPFMNQVDFPLNWQR